MQLSSNAVQSLPADLNCGRTGGRFAGGQGRVRTQECSNSNCSNTRYAAFIVFFALVFVLEIHAAPLRKTSGNQDAAQSAPVTVAPAVAPPQPKKVELPEGDGKPLAVEYCQDCHRLTNLSRSHKSADDWHETVETMIDRGARLPPENVDALVQYLATNFGPKQIATPSDAAAPPIPSAATPAIGSSDPPPAAPVQAKAKELPEGEGKAIATEDCQTCHKLTNLLKAHKSLDEWRDTVKTMIDRGADVPADKMETLLQYLAKNFGPKAADSATGGAPAGAAPGSSSQSQ